jgi:hypothetical protein
MDFGDVRFREQSGHSEVGRQCPLMTHCGSRVGPRQVDVWFGEHYREHLCRLF